MSAVLSGPMFEPAESGVFKSIYGKSGAHYNIFSVRDENGMKALREMFEDAPLSVQYRRAMAAKRRLHPETAL